MSSQCTSNFTTKKFEISCTCILCSYWRKSSILVMLKYFQ